MKPNPDKTPSSPTSGANIIGLLKDAVLPLDALEHLAESVNRLLLAARQGGCFVSTPPPPYSPHKFADVCNEFMLSKDRAGRNSAYLKHLRYTLSRFGDGREGRPVGSITAAELEGWLHGRPVGIRTKIGDLLNLRVLFGFAVKRGYLAANPALAVDKPRFDSTPPGIHTVDQVRMVLETARVKDLNLCRQLAVQYFAGLRTAEALRLVEAEIGRDYIEVTAAKAKTRRRRLVRIAPNLRAWLDLGGKLPLTQANNRHWWLVKELARAGVPWPRNAARHSFCSYHLAQHQNAAKTALEAGHSEAMLFAHYREIVTPEDAAKYWEIRPK